MGMTGKIVLRMDGSHLSGKDAGERPFNPKAVRFPIVQVRSEARDLADYSHSKIFYLGGHTALTDLGYQAPNEFTKNRTSQPRRESDGNDVRIPCLTAKVARRLSWENEGG